METKKVIEVSKTTSDNGIVNYGVEVLSGDMRPVEFIELLLAQVDMLANDIGVTPIKIASDILQHIVSRQELNNVE